MVASIVAESKLRSSRRSRENKIWRRKQGRQILSTWPATAAKFGVRQILFREKQDLAVVWRDGSRQKKKQSGGFTAVTHFEY